MATPTTNVTFTTDYGAFVVSLYPDAAPLSVANFLYYAENLTTGYNALNSFFHRSVPGFVLQGGGFGTGTGAGVVIPVQGPVPSEISASRPNVAGTIAFATQANDPNSGTDQFFFNLVDNPGLNSGFSVFGAITSGFSVLQTIAGLQIVDGSSLNPALSELPIDRGASAATFVLARDVVDFRVSVNVGIVDATIVAPFAQASLTDAVATETLTLTYNGANGAFSGGGFSGSAGAYSFTGTPAQAQAALRGLVFIPTANEVAVGQSVTTPFNLAISAGGVTRTDTTLSVTALSVNDAPVLGGVLTNVGIMAGGSVRPFAAFSVADPDIGQGATVTVNFAAGNGSLSGGGFTGGAGVYTFNAGSAAQAQAALRAAVFTSAGGVGTTGLAVTVSDGIASSTDARTLVTASAAPAANAASTTSGFNAAMGPNVIRALPSGADAQDPTGPIYAQLQAQRAIAAQLDAGQLSQAQAEQALVHLVDGTTSVAVASYAFFTGRTPSLAGLSFLVHSTANPTDLNDPYYLKFTTENRYINFAANLGVFGAGQAKFSADYGALDLRAATAKAYQAVFGVAADAAKVSALLDTSVPNGLGGSFTRADYFAQFGGDGVNGQGTKAAMIGFLLSNAVATGGGVYGAADLHYVQALAHGGVPAGDVPLIPDYSPEVTLVGTPATLDPTVTG